MSAIVTTGHAEFDGADTAGVELSDSLSPPETIAEHLLAAVRVEGSGVGTVDSLLPPEHWIDTAMVAELVEHARKLFAERARQGSKSGDGGGGGGSGAEETRTAAAEGNGEDGGGEGKDTASSSSSSSSQGVVAPFEVTIGGGESDGTARVRTRSSSWWQSPSQAAEEGQATSAEVPWAKWPLGRLTALRKRPGHAVKLVPVEEDIKGTERCKDGSIILHDETMVLDRIHACSPCLTQCIMVVWVLFFVLYFLSALVGIPALPFAILKFTNTTDVLFGARVVNASSAAASAMNISNITFDHTGPSWWVVARA